MPESATACNCTACRRFGALWAYEFEGEGIDVSGPTQTYTRGKWVVFWRQAANYFDASRDLPPISAPLTSYYCFLNATKALLLVKGASFTDRHGVSGDFDPLAKRVLSNEVVTMEASGIRAALSQYLQEPEADKVHSLTDLLASVPFVHRAYRHTFKSQSELFIPLRNVVYRRHPDGTTCGSPLRSQVDSRTVEACELYPRL